MTNAVNQKKPFIFMQKAYINISDLVTAMACNWKEGRQALFSGKIRDYFKKVDKNIAVYSGNSEKEFLANSKEADFIYWKWIYKVNTVVNLYWQDTDYGNVQQVINRLKKSTLTIDTEFMKLITLLIKERLFSMYILQTGKSQGLVANVKYLERCYNKQDSRFNKEGINVLLYVVLSETKTFEFDLKSYHNLKDLAGTLQVLANVSKEKLKSKSQTLFADDYNLNPFFEGWLINLGHIHEISLWKEKFQEGTYLGISDIDIDTDDSEVMAVENTMHTDTAKVDFMHDINGFETQFLKLLTNYPESIDNRKVFFGLLKDFFPQNPMQTSLITVLYDMEIVKAIKESDCLNVNFSYRFTKRLSDEKGIRQEVAQWAVSLWSISYGEKVLAIPCELTL